MLFLVTYLVDADYETLIYDAILQTERIIAVLEHRDDNGNCVLYYDDMGEIAEYEIGMSVAEFYKFLTDYSKNNLLQ